MTKHQLRIENIKFFFRTLLKRYDKYDRAEIKKNKKLIKEFPFLFPSRHSSGKPIKNYDYTWTELINLECGWIKSFGIEMCQRLKENLLKADYLYKYQITQIKEKYGTLRWYDNGVPDSIAEEHERIIEYYEDKSKLVCTYCGKETKYITVNGWTNYVCEDCFNDYRLKNTTTYQELTWSHIPVRTRYDNNKGKKEESQLKGEMMVAWKRYSKYNNADNNIPKTKSEELENNIISLWE